MTTSTGWIALPLALSAGAERATLAFATDTGKPRHELGWAL